MLSAIYSVELSCWIICNDFAYLSDDIIYDVLQVAHFERLTTQIGFRMPCGGRWDKIAGKFKMIEFNEGQLDRRWNNFSQEERKNVFVSKLHLFDNSNFGEIRDLAPNIYESVVVERRVLRDPYSSPQFASVRNIDNSPNPATADVSSMLFLEALRPRFTTIQWKRDSKEPLEGEIDFFKRQLRSPHLRILESDSPVLAQAEFTTLLADFVGKPGFEKLCLHPSSAPLAAKVFEAAYEAWLQRKDHEHLESAIDAKISAEDLKEFTAKIPDFHWTKQEAAFVRSVELERPRMSYSYSEIPDFRSNEQPTMIFIYSEMHPKTAHYEMSMSSSENTTPGPGLEFSRAGNALSKARARLHRFKLQSIKNLKVRFSRSKN